MRVRLYMFEASSACLVARLALELAAIDYERVELTPFTHVRALRRLGFERGTAPALELDGRRVQGSRAIARALDELRPEARLFPAEPVGRRAVEGAEALGEEIQNAARRLLYCVAHRRPYAWASFMRRAQPLRARVLLTVGAPLLVRVASRYVGASDDRVRSDLGRLPDQLARVEQLVADGTIGGAQPNAADLQIGVNVAYLLLSDDLAVFVGPLAAAHARRIAPLGATPFPRVLPPSLYPSASSSRR